LVSSMASASTHLRPQTALPHTTYSIPSTSAVAVVQLSDSCVGRIRMGILILLASRPLSLNGCCTRTDKNAFTSSWGKRALKLLVCCRNHGEEARFRAEQAVCVGQHRRHQQEAAPGRGRRGGTAARGRHAGFQLHFKNGKAHWNNF
jgi:hypothetical protein